MYKAWLISDTHGHHRDLIVPDDIDIVIHSGDESNYRLPELNEEECIDFLNWYNDLPIPIKIFVPGNHSTAIAKGLVKVEDYESIIYLNHSSFSLPVGNGDEQINFFGSPYTPTFGVGWAYNIDRDKIEKYWNKIPDNTHFLITHGPPYGILDHTENYDTGLIESVGCKALYNRIKTLKHLRYHQFGHLHQEKLIYNQGIFFETNRLNLKFINASVVNLRTTKLTNNGIIVEI